jgi:CheY-like chemotaxis protein
MKVTICSSGEEALLFISHYTYDIVLLDIIMPHINGVELATMIRDTTTTTPFLIALSSFSGMSAGNDIFDSHLLKPVKKSKLFRTLVELYRPRTRSSSRNGLDLNIHVLAVDDNYCNRIVIKEILLSCRIPEQNIKILSSGDETIEWLQKYPNKYHVLLLDIQMPKTSGYMVYDYIRDNEIHIYTIGITANSTSEERDTCLNIYSMNDFLCNPLTIMSVKGALIKYQKSLTKLLV